MTTIPRTFATISILAALTISVVGQSPLMFPNGPYYSSCRGPDTAVNLGGDDDYYNVWYFEVDLTRIQPDATSAPEFYIVIFDGDCSPIDDGGGTNDFLGDSVVRTAFEYRLYHGPNASGLEEFAAGTGHGVSWGGTQMDIDSDPNDDTLRTDDPDDTDANSGEDLRNQGYSIIPVDMTFFPGDIIGTKSVYKLVVDGRPTIGGAAGNNAGNDRNLYKVMATQDSTLTNRDGISLMTYELTIAGRPTNCATDAEVEFFIPSTPDNLVDLQSLDMDQGVSAIGAPITSRLVTFNIFFPNSETFESGEQNVNGAWKWSSVAQIPVPTVGVGNGQQGATLSTMGEVGQIWTYYVDAITPTNPFSIRLRSSQAAGSMWLPMKLTKAFEAYGSGALGHYGAGLPLSASAGVNVFRIWANRAPAGAVGIASLGTAPSNTLIPGFNIQAYAVGGAIALLPVVFDASGEFRLDWPVPPGLPSTYLYSQFVAWNGAGWPYSNGLAINLLR